MNIQTGDIILTSKRSVIARFMDLFQEDACVWGHILIVKDNDIAWEAHWTLREVKLSKTFKKYKHWKIIRKTDLTEGQKEIMRKVAPQLLGKFYSPGRIFLQLLDHVFSTDKFSGYNNNQYKQVCSSYAAWIYEMSCRYRFNGVHWSSADPDDIEDDQINHPESWLILKEK